MFDALRNYVWVILYLWKEGMFNFHMHLYIAGSANSESSYSIPWICLATAWNFIFCISITKQTGSRKDNGEVRVQYEASVFSDSQGQDENN